MSEAAIRFASDSIVVRIEFIPIAWLAALDRRDARGTGSGAIGIVSGSLERLERDWRCACFCPSGRELRRIVPRS